MDDDQGPITSLIQIDSTGSLAITLVLVAISMAALRSAFRLLVLGHDLARAQCRRWAMFATAVAVAWYALSSGVRVEPRIPILVAIAAVDCWLALATSPRPTVPSAIVRPRVRRVGGAA